MGVQDWTLSHHLMSGEGDNMEQRPSPLLAHKVFRVVKSAKPHFVCANRKAISLSFSCGRREVKGLSMYVRPLFLQQQFA